MSTTHILHIPLYHIVAIMLTNLFAYGTLMVKHIMLSVSGINLDGSPGVLHDYQRRLMRGEVYPGIRPDNNGCVEGVLYPKIGQQAWHRLDNFEGELYRRETVAVDLQDGNRVKAQTYVIRPEYHDLLTTTPWTLEQFLHSGQSPFFSKCPGFFELRNID